MGSLISTLKLHDGESTDTSVISLPPASTRRRSNLRLKQRDKAPRPAPGGAAATLREDTRSAIAHLTQAPAMGWIAKNLLQLLRKEDVDLNEVVDLIAKDPAISARILRMSNSAMVAPAQRIYDLNTAVNLLGIQRVRLTAQALITMQDTSHLVEGFNWKHLWIHSFACALLAAEIPRRLKLQVPENAYLAGLLHDLGKILLSYLNPPTYRQLLMEAICDSSPLELLELRFFGLTHEEAGAEFARCNKLPGSVIAAIEWHHNPEEAGEHQLITAAISVANYLAKTHGLGFSGSPLAQTEETLEETKGWKILSAAALRPPKGNDFHLQLRPFIADLKHELHSWLGKG